MDRTQQPSAYIYFRNLVASAALPMPNYSVSRRLLPVVLLGTMLLFQVGLKAQSSLLWAVTEPGKKDTSWLLGTIHEFPEQVLVTDSTLEERIARSNRVVLEVQFNARMFFSMFAMAGTVAGSEDGAITPELKLAMERFYLNDRKVSNADFDKAVAEKSIGTAMDILLYKTYGTTKTDGVENDLRQMAMRKGVAVTGLDDNMRDITSWYAHYTAISEARRAGENPDSTINRMFFETGNLFCAYGLQDSSYMAAEGLTDYYADGLSLVEWRNLRWMKQLTPWMRQRSFVAVGAAHLFGTNGVLTLLKARGFELTPVESNFRGPQFWKFLSRFSNLYEIQ